MRPQPLLLALCATGLLAAAGTTPAADWPQFGYDAAHSGFNTAENTITPANVAQLALAYPAAVSLPASVDSAPVYLSNVATAGGTKDLLFLLSKNGRLMAVDAADGSVVWSKTISGNQPTTASPAIDPNRQFVYSYGLDGKAHKFAVGDGTETTTGGWPQTISLKTSVEKGASGFAIANAAGINYLLVVTNGYIGDGGDYQGHLVSINLSTGTQKIFNTVCSDLAVHFDAGGTAGVDDCGDVRSGIWGRSGAVFDAATGRVFIATGNGHFNANTGGHNWGDSVLALKPDGSGAGGGLPLDSYTPANFAQLDSQDKDLGSVSPAILPVPSGSAVAHVGVQAGKDGQLRMFDLEDMSGQGGAGHVAGELQQLPVPQGANGFSGDLMREQPAVWVNPADHSTWLFAGNGSGISGLQLGLDGSNVPALTERWNKTGSSNGSTSPAVANGVLFHAGACSAGTCVIARDPLTGNVLWTSPPIGSLHWQSVIVVNGAVYVTDNGSKLWKFAVPRGDEIFKNGFDPAS